MTALGILMSVSFVTVSRSKPLAKLSPVRPFTSVFHPALFLSILGQFTLHLVSMMLAVRESKKHQTDFKPDVEGEFKPAIINSVVFLVSAVQQVSCKKSGRARGGGGRGGVRHWHPFLPPCPDPSSPHSSSSSPRILGFVRSLSSL